MLAAENANDSVSVGVIQDIAHVTESPNHIANYVASDFGVCDNMPATNRLGTVYVTAEVLNNDKEVYMPLRDGTPVCFANENEIRQARGIVLFSAEQFRSAIHKRVKGNCATNVYERTNGVEIATGDYRYLPKNINSIMTRLPKGELIVQHPLFRGLLKIQFPRPAYLQPE
ncbi:MAG: hypothetical protein LBH00_09810, partial [Planctomycetaceae bacterium]|nr:hypothetical protein [Planctomycetaceae bacterium]